MKIFQNISTLILIFLCCYSLQGQEIITSINSDEYETNLSYMVLNNDWIFLPLGVEGYDGVSTIHITENDTVKSQIYRNNTYQFGSAFDSDDDWMIIYAEEDYDMSTFNNFYFYQLDGDEWVSRQHISLNNAQDDSYALSNISMDNGWTVIGDYGNDSLYIYHLENGQWNKHQTIAFDDTTGNVASPRFGFTVDISGDYIVAKASNYESLPSEEIRFAYYIYMRQADDNWTKIHSVYSDSTSYGYYESKTDLSGNTLVYSMVNDAYDGEVHVLDFDESEINEKAVYTNENTYFGTEGSNIKLTGSELVISDYSVASNSGAFNLYRKVNGNWEYITSYTYPDANSYLGRSIARDDDYLYVSTSTEIHLFGVRSPVVNSVSKGHSSSYARINWEDNSEIEDGFTVYRDGLELATTSASARSYFDYEGVPGKVHTYGVTTYDEQSGWESKPANGYGYKQPSGLIEGVVQTPLGAGVKDVEISLEADGIETNRALYVDSTQNGLVVLDVANFPDLAVTVAFWVKTSRDSSVLFNYANSSYYDAFTILNPQALQIRISDRSLETAVNISDGEWHYISVTWRSADGQIYIYDDGDTVFDTKFLAGEIIDSDNGSFYLGTNILNVADPSIAAHPYSGWMDELRIWNTTKSDTAINQEMYSAIIGNEENLVAAFSFDDAQRYPENFVADQVWKSSNHAQIQIPVFETDPEQLIPIQSKVSTDASGKFSFKNVYFDESRNFTITPFKEDHGFLPGSAITTLNLAGPREQNIGFDDTTSFTVSGYVSYQNTNCFLPNAEIIKNGQSTGVYTDANGFYQITVEEAGNYQFEIYFADSSLAHRFRPSSLNLSVNDNLFDVNFLDVTTSTLQGRVGAACDNNFGVGTLRIASNSGCYERIIQTDENGYYNIDLPASDYFIEVTDLDGANDIILNSLNTFSTDLTFQDTIINFIYRETPTIQISGFPETCSTLPVVQQYDQYFLTIEVLDNYDGNSCPVDTGFITIYDAISDKGNNPLTIPIQNGQAYYIMQPGMPNILDGGNHPFQKQMTIVANIDGDKVSLVQWAVVTGQRPRAETFVTKTPELPLMILRDPPGDQSYAYLEKGSSITSNFTLSHEIGGSAGLYTDIYLGAGVPVPFTGIVIGARTHIDGQILGGKDNNHGTSVTTTISQTERFSTSNNDDITGEQGDVFMGASLNMIYALTDVIGYDEQTCSVVRDTQLVWGSEEINTTYIYTESHIRNTLLPQLKQLRTLVSPDSAILLQTYVDVWEQVLENNQRQKEAAQKIKNISFSAGSNYEFTETTSKDTTTHIDFTIFIDSEVKIGVGIGDGGVFADTELGVTAKFRWSKTEIRDTTRNSQTTTGYVLSDDDPGDFFSIDLKEDRQTGSLVFDLVGGRSSCPWEEGTQPRDGPALNVNSYEQFDVNPEKPAAFILGIGNTSQSDEIRDYSLSVIQSSNLDGAIIRVGGVVIEDALYYTIPSGEQITATMAVERGPLAYDYENLKIRLYSECDPSISDTLNFSVHFENPCSDVNLFRPENNWLVNISSNDTLPVIINNYDITDANLDNIKLEYRPVSGAWKTARIYQKNELPSQYISFPWDVSSLPNGSYELRAAARCGNIGISYSPIATGKIDRSALVLFGKPQPADKVLNLGEDIRFNFTEDLSCDDISVQNVSLQKSNGIEIPVRTACSSRSLIITPDADLAELEGQQLTVIVSGIKDVKGNRLINPARWTFTVNQNPVYWSNSILENTFYKSNDIQVTRKIVNVGGQNASYTLTSVPEWLTVSVTSDNIAPSGEKVISFQLSNNLNPGTYLDTLFAQTEEGDEPLFIEITLLPTPPDWTVNAADFQYSMNIIAQLNIEGNPSDDEFDMISAFIANDVRGVCNVQYVSDIYGYLAFLTVYSNTMQGPQIQFRGWDASEGNEYGNIGETYIFQDGNTLGSVSNPLILNPQGIVQNIDLNQGWTWISLNVENRNMDINEVLASVHATQGDIIKSQTRFAQYLDEVGWQGSLRILEAGKSYMVKLSDPSAIEYIGKRINIFNKTVFLEQGWNWFGYPENRITEVNIALENYNATDGDIIKNQYAFATYNAATHMWTGSLEYLIPGEGYLLKSNTAANFRIRSLAKTNAINTIAALPDEWQFNPFSYEFTMNMVAVIDFSDKSKLDSLDIVAAFTGDECRGITTPVFNEALSKYQVFLTMHANKNEKEMSFRVLEQETGIVYTTSKIISFFADSLVGDAINPVKLKTSFGTNEGALPTVFMLYQNYPNPFNPVTTIRYELPRRAHVKLVLYNVLGQQVSILENRQQNTGRYKIDLNANRLGLASGLYFYKINAGNYSKVHKMLLIK